MKALIKRIIGWVILISLFLGLAVVLPALVYGLKTALIIFAIAVAIALLFDFSIKLIIDKK